jgi:hypothetical protein
MNAAIQFWLRPLALALSCSSLLAAADGQWNKKPPSSWSKGDILRLLTDSPWSRTQTITTVDERASRPSLTPPLNRPDFEQSPREIRDLADLLASEDHSDQVIVMVTFETAAINGQVDEIQAALETGDTEKLKPETSIEVQGKAGAKRVELQEYKSWGRRSGLFKFARATDGKPWLSADKAEFRFRTRLGKSAPIVAAFKPKDMLFEDALEY